MRKATQALILLLIALSARVAVGLINRQDMWRWIVTYWIVLTVKNGFDYINAKRGGKDES